MSESEQARESKGRLLAGRYRLGGVLGRGGMGTVWRATDETLGRTVAVKELRFPSSIDDDEKRRLITRTLREAKAIARIRNSGAVTVFDVVDEDDRPWIVMELVEGKSLAEFVREDGLLKPKRAAEVGLAVLDVLRDAHREGILHRDVKPSNVLIAEDGRVVLTDFGIAQVEGDPSVTSTGMLVGAPSYISPERARGHKPGPAADLWSLGGLLYASVEGVPPYDKGSAIATLTAVMTESVEPPKHAGPLEPVIYGLLAKDPAQRLDDAGARSLLMKVLAEPEGEPAALDQTKVVPLPPTPAPEGAAARRPAKRGLGGAGRGRGAGRAAAAGGAVAASNGAVGGPARSGAAGGAAGAGGSGAGAAASTRASLTDVVPRRTLIVVAVVVVLAVIATVLALNLSGGDDDKGQSGKGGDKAASTASRSGGEKSGRSGESGGAEESKGAGAGESAGEGASPSSGSSKSGDDEKDDSGASGKADDDADKGGSDDAATTTYRAAQGFSIGLPKGWSYRSADAAGARFTGPDGQKLLIGWTGSPKSDPVQDWKNQEGSMRRAQYQRIRIEKVDYRGWNAADWEFTYTDSGTKYRSVDRGFVVNDSLGYGMMYTARAADWDSDGRKATWKTLSETFEPKS